VEGAEERNRFLVFVPVQKLILRCTQAKYETISFETLLFKYIPFYGIGRYPPRIRISFCVVFLSKYFIACQCVRFANASNGCNSGLHDFSSSCDYGSRTSFEFLSRISEILAKKPRDKFQTKNGVLETSERIFEDFND
jgi:hypothetical protein